MICWQVIQAAFKSLLASVAWKSKTRVKQDNSRRRSRSSVPVDSISADQSTHGFISGHTLSLANELATNTTSVLLSSVTSKWAALNIKYELALSMQKSNKVVFTCRLNEKNDAFLVFRVSLSVELWLVIIGSEHLSIKRSSNDKAPRAGQKRKERLCVVLKTNNFLIEW